MLQLGGQMLRIAAVPTIAHDDHNRAVSQHPTRPMPVEVTEGVADSSPAAEVVNASAHRLQRSIEVTSAQESRDAGQAGRKHERLEVFATRDGVRKDHPQSGVALHGAAHVADDYDGTAAHSWAAIKQLHQLAA